MKTKDHLPPQAFLRFFRWYCHPKLRDHIEGDLMEEYNQRHATSKKGKADIRFIMDVILLFRPGIIRPAEGTINLNTYGMFRNYFKTGWRNLVKGRGFSLINIGGLALGMTVAMLIGLWIYDELSFNKYHDNYDRIAQVWSGGTSPETSAIEGHVAVQFPVGAVLKNSYPHYFRHVLMAFWIQDYSLSIGDDKFNRRGLFIEGDVIEMLSLKMVKGNTKSLENPNSIILSQSSARAIFGEENPMNKMLRIDGHIDVQVTGVYENIPPNNHFSYAHFISTWPVWVSSNEWLKNNEHDWDNRMINIFVELQPGITAETANAAIRNLYYENMPEDFLETVNKYKPFIQVIPMNTWHLYSEFEDGKPAGGRIAFVWLFGAIGLFVLLLACINFINLSTARAEKRAREVGIRKAVGSGNGQLIAQFLSESFMVVLFAFVLSIVLVIALQPWFNVLADKRVSVPATEPVFWMMALGFIVLTGLMAGLYPAFYLTSFQPVKVLKGVLRLGRLAALPRKVLVVVQFTVSVILIIGTLIVYRQVQFARNRPVGFDKQGLITVRMNDQAFAGKHEALKSELLNSGVVAEVSTSSNPLTDVWNSTSGYSWEGKDPNAESDFVVCQVSHDFGKTIGWKIVEGRDFSKDFASDPENAVIVNEAAVKYMGLEDPVGKELVDVDEFGKLKWTKKIIGVVKDIVMGSPYEKAYETIFYYDTDDQAYLMHIKIDPAKSTEEALTKIEDVFKKVVPSTLLAYKFVDGEYARKFSQEERVGKLAGIFSFLAIFISCLGLFGLAAFVASQRSKEIGIRKVMGANVSALWKMLSKDFVVLVVIACTVAIPIAYVGMHSWLQRYTYRTEISWWIILATCAAALAITLLTVSYQSIKAVMMNPVKSLRSE